MQKYKLGLKAEREDENGKPLIISPYAKLRDLILGQQDFVKKQYDVIRFQNTFTREAYSDIISQGEKESPFWFYCIETNAKLLPTFIYTLAATWVNDPQKYLSVMDQIIKEIGVSGDDEESWVDKHSGFIITKENFSTDEGFDEGFRVSTRAILEEDAEDKIKNALMEKGVGISDKERKIVQNTPEMRSINNIINAICTSMGISLESEKEWMISDIVELLRQNIPNEGDYNKQVKEMANKGKPIPSFKEFYNTLLLYYTLGLILIAIQTNIPSIRTKRTFPGCIRSFTGYPFEGAGDLSSIQYLACIVYKIRSSVEPWNVLARKKESVIANSIKDAIDKYLLQLDNVKRKTQEKMEYLLMGNGGQEIEQEYDIRKWVQYLPPLINFQIKGLQPVSPEFEKTLLHDLKSGSSQQSEKIGVLQGKAILFSLGIVEKINAIVEKKDVILRKMNNEPYLENACCNERSGEEKRVTTLQYFEKEDSSIAQYNQIVGRITNIFKDLFFYSSASLLYSPFNTKNIYPPVDLKFSERTIYKAFIDFCHFQSLKPIPEDLLPLCVDKPDYLNSGENLTEIILKLKNDGRNYSYDHFLRLLQMVSRNRMIVMETEKPVITSIQSMRDVIEIVKDQNDTREKELMDLLNPLLDTYELGAEHSKTEIRNLNNYLSRSIDSLKAKIIDFLVKNKSENSTKNKIKAAMETIQTLNIWDLISTSDEPNKKRRENSTVYQILEFYKEYIENFVSVFPSIIKNRIHYDKIRVPNYWKLSRNHNQDIEKIVAEYYVNLQSFYGSRVITLLLDIVPDESEIILLLSNKTPCLSSIVKKGGEPEPPIFDERTSKMLFEYYLLKILKIYIDLTDDNRTIVVEKTDRNAQSQNVNNNTYNERILNEPLYTNDFVEEIQLNQDTLDESNVWRNNNLFIGNKKELKQKTADLMIAFLEILQKNKEIIDVSYDKIKDRVFKLKQREKDSITDRLREFNDEKRDVNTLLKINKLGEWSKGLQKGLTVYVRENYDEERDFMEKMMQYERDFSRQPRNLKEGENMEDYLEQVVRDEDAEREAYDMSNITEDYMDGYEPDGFEEEENYGDYN